MDSKIAPIGIPRLDNAHQRSFTRDGAALITKIVVSKPRVTRGKRNPRFADRAPSFVLENNQRSGVHTCRVGRLRIEEFPPVMRRCDKFSKTAEEFVIQMLVQRASGYEDKSKDCVVVCLKQRSSSCRMPYDRQKSFLDAFGVDPRSGHGFDTPFPTFAQKIE